MYSERGDTRKPITFATSSGRSIRPKGIWRTRRRVNSSGDWLSSAACSRTTDAHMSVSTKPGHTQFTRIPSAACAIARLLVMLMTAALLALYGRLARLPILPAIDAKLTITPRFLRDHGGQHGLAGEE